MRIDWTRPLSSYDWNAIARNVPVIVYHRYLTWVHGVLFWCLCALAAMCLLGLFAAAGTILYLLPPKFSDRFTMWMDALFREEVPKEAAK